MELHKANAIRIDFSRGRRVGASSSDTCDVFIAEGLLGRINEFLIPLLERNDSLKDPSAFFVVTDSNVSRIYAESLQDSLSQISKTFVIEFPAGEQHKTIETVSFVASRLNNLGADRNAIIFALGGGVVGDLAGFVASVFKRGLQYFQIPTTLLAQVDSSIGGKTGVNAKWGKNQFGTFYQPKSVFIDPKALDSLPSSELINGIAEIVKCAIVSDPKMFGELIGRDLFDLNEIRNFVERTCRIKARIVSVDETEESLRAILNYGHTVGHAIESSTNYDLSHGRSLILGMIAEGGISHKMGFFSNEDLERQNDFLIKIISLSRTSVPYLDPAALLTYALSDKKSSFSTIKMSLPESIGTMHRVNESYKIPVSRELFEDSITQLSNLI